MVRGAIAWTGRPRTGSRLRGRAALGAAGLLALVVVAAAVVLAADLSAGSSRTPAPGLGLSRTSPSRLPLLARAPISAALGAETAAYAIHAHGGGLRAAGAGRRLQAGFTSAGATFSAGHGRLRLRLAAIGYGSAGTAVARVAPTVHANRVVYAHPGVGEWYANGPLGVEQGFSIPRAPAGPRRGPLTLALALSGDTRATLSRGGAGLTLTRDGRPALRYTGLAATDAGGRRLHSWLALEGSRLLVRVDTRRARFPVRVDPFVQSAELTASDAAEDNDLGMSIAISGNTIAVGSAHTVGSHVDQGAVYVFVEPRSGWADATQTAELSASDGEADDRLGSSVAISGTTVVAGAPTREADSHPFQGAAYVFVEPPTGWTNATQTAELGTSEDGAYEQLGEAVAASGDTVVVSGRDHFDGEASEEALYVFVKPADGWRDETQTAVLSQGSPTLGDGFGTAVAMDGTTIVTGAPYANAEKGAAFVFTEPPTGWADATPTAELTASDGIPETELGMEVAVSGKTIVADAQFNESDKFSASLYLFFEPPSGWTDATQNEEVANGSFLFSTDVRVAISGDTVAASLPFMGPRIRNPEIGAAWVFEPATGAPASIAAPSISGRPVPGQTLDAVGGTWTNEPTSVARRWLRCNATGGECTPIAGAEDADYVVGEEDEGHRLELQETASNAAGSSAPVDSAPTELVAAAAPVGTAPPGISGSAVAGQTLTETHASWENPVGSYAYQWLRCDAAGHDCSEIAGAEDPEYVVGEGDMGSTLEVAETAGNGAGSGAPETSAATAVVPREVPRNLTPPQIAGTARLGQTLHEVHGTWSPAPTGFTYQWLRCNPLGVECAPIAGATSDSYAPVEADVGSTLEVAETAANTIGAGSAQTSQPTALVAEGLGSLILAEARSEHEGEPTLFWGAPTAATLTGCDNGLAVVSVVGRELGVGDFLESSVALPQVAGQPGTFEGALPAEYPIHGAVDIHPLVLCPPRSVLVPSAGPAGGGNTVVVPGSGFTDVTGVSFGGAPAESYTVQSEDVIQAVAPAGAGTVPVTVSEAGVESEIDDYTYQAIQSISPASGPPRGGTWVTIAGTGIAGATAVSFGGTAVQFVQLSEGKIEALSPPGHGTAGVEVQTPLGETSATPSDEFAYESASPGVARATSSRDRRDATPGMASTGPGRQATHGAANSGPGRRATHGAAPSPRRVSAGHAIPAVLGSEAAEEVLDAIYEQGTTVMTGLDRVNTLAAAEANVLNNSCENTREVVEEAVKLAIAPAEEEAVAALIPLVEEGEVALLGETGPILLVVFAITPVTVTAMVNELVNALVRYDVEGVMAACPPEKDPDGAEEDDDSSDALIDPSGTVLDGNGHAVAGATVTLLDASLASGPFSPVDPSGPGIEPAVNPETTQADGVFHWEVSPGYYEVSATAPGCAAPGDPLEPAATIGPYQVPPPQVGLTVTLACSEEAPPTAPSVTGLSVDTGPPAGGTAVTVSGSGFTPSSTVSFGGSPAASVTYVSPQTLLASSPAGQGEAEVQVQTLGATSPASPGDRFFYGAAPAIAAISSHSGPAGGGERLVVSGTGLTDAGVVAFGGLPARSFTVKSDTEIEVSTPAEPAGEVDVQVVTPAGTSEETASDRYTFLAAGPPPGGGETESHTPSTTSSPNPGSGSPSPAHGGHAAGAPGGHRAGGCVAPTVELLEAYVADGRLHLLGRASPRLAGKTVRIALAGHGTVARAKVAPNGDFRASVRPTSTPRRGARLVARIDGHTSSPVRLGRRTGSSAPGAPPCRRRDRGRPGSRS